MKKINTKETDAWVMTIWENDSTTRYEITTLPGKYRGGKIYFWNKLVRVLSWNTLLTLEINGTDTEILLTPESGDYLIPAWVPNIFYFPELTEITEEFPKWTKTEAFERYRQMKK